MHLRQALQSAKHAPARISAWAYPGQTEARMHGCDRPAVAQCALHARWALDLTQQARCDRRAVPINGHGGNWDWPHLDGASRVAPLPGETYPGARAHQNSDQIRRPVAHFVPGRHRAETHQAGSSPFVWVRIRNIPWARFDLPSWGPSYHRRA